MKKVIYKYLSGLMVFGVLACTSEDKVIDKVFNEVETGAFLRVVSTTGGALNKNNPASEASATIEFDGQEASLLSSVEVFITYADGLGADAVDDSFGPVPLTTLSPSDFTTSSFGLPIATISYTLTEALALGGITPGDTFGGDAITMSWTLNLTDGRSFDSSTANGNIAAVGGFYSSPYQYKSLIVCPPAPGDWIIDMVDTYGDGWQTPTGLGITFELGDGTVFEVGLCSAYGGRPGCTDDYWSGTAVVTIPEGTSSMVVNFPGDTYGEIEAVITSPTGNVVADIPAGTASGPIDIDFCNDN